MTAWSATCERGGKVPLRIMLWLTRHAGWFATALVLPGVTAWYYACSPTARAASREFLGHALDRPAGIRDVFRHLHSFACAIVDRVMLLSGPARAVRTEVAGLPLLEAVVASGRGCLLLGGHLGSFEVLRGLADRAPVDVRALMYQTNAGALTRMLHQLNPHAADAIIPIGDVQSLLRVHEVVAAGSIVGILADRAPAGARTVDAPFFGRRAAFPAGPFVLAASLGVPVLTFYAARLGRRHYRIQFEPFAERVVLNRETRQADLRSAVADYAAWLERGCRAHPFDWFNFFPFWESHGPTPTRGRPADRGARLGGARPDRLAAG